MKTLAGQGIQGKKQPEYGHFFEENMRYWDVMAVNYVILVLIYKIGKILPTIA